MKVSTTNKNMVKQKLFNYFCTAFVHRPSFNANDFHQVLKQIIIISNYVSLSN